MVELSPSLPLSKLIFVLNTLQARQLEYTFVYGDTIFVRGDDCEAFAEILDENDVPGLQHLLLPDHAVRKILDEEQGRWWFPD
ncbi:hypothetical protein [Novispirillum itersonii]|uniref:hypothetical protein n=1 Tax=Novispirillum itersonii TaxID=189 RepID=UPI00037A129B|nr:hypothetical protein [Novispirillum itersonii]